MNRKDLTVIYYSSNKEDPAFEKKITNRIKEQIGTTRLISVTHKPMDMGENIVVGDVGLSDYNIYRQIQIACLKTHTKYVCTAEADVLYPPTGYFDFIPPDSGSAYHLRNLHIFFKGTGIFHAKAFSLCALFTNRYYLLSRLDRCLRDDLQWRPVHKRSHPIFNKWKGWIEEFNKISVINIKTGYGMRGHTGTETDFGAKPVIELPYWGKAVDLEKKFL
jgi:hypothetical protein